MRRLLYAAFISAALVQGALAQGNQVPSGASPAPGSVQNMQNSAPIPQTIRQKLESAGYSDVRIMPTSFFVQAKDKQGDPVEIFITPRSMTEVHALNANEQGNISSSGQANPPDGAQ
jgi:hypothetical protein